MPVVGVVLIIFFGLIVVVLTVISLIFYRIVVFRQPKTFLLNNPDLEEISEEMSNADTLDIPDIPIADPEWVDEQQFEILEMKSYDGLLLKGYYLAALVPTTKTAILAHGYGGNAKENMGSIACMFHEEFGYNVFMPDARGHGISEGTYIGLGWHDRLDYVKWMSLLLQRVGADAQFVLHGISMGGATMLMAGGEQLPEQVKCVISDCSYTSVSEILTYQLKRLYKLPPFPFLRLTSLVCKLRAGYFFSDASPLKHIVKMTKPVLFIHGGEDTFVPTEMVYRLYESCPTCKELLVIPEGGHGLSYPADRAAYTEKVKLFIGRFVS